MVITEETALRRLAKACAEKEYSRAEIFDKIKRWGLDVDLTHHLMATLEENDFVNDERFCRSFINDKLRISKWGRFKIAEGLRLKNIPEEVIEAHLSAIDEDEYFNILCKVIEVKKKSVQSKNKKELKVKLARFALSRGFETEYIVRCIGEFPGSDALE